MDELLNPLSLVNKIESSFFFGILDGIKLLNKRMDTIEKMIFDLKLPEVEPTTEEIDIIRDYENGLPSITFLTSLM